MTGLPDIVEDEQTGFLPQQSLQAATAQLLVEGGASSITESLRQLQLPQGNVRMLTKLQPEHAIGERAPHLAVTRQRGRQRRFANADHSYDGDSTLGLCKDHRR